MCVYDLTLVMYYGSPTRSAHPPFGISLAHIGWSARSPGGWSARSPGPIGQELRCGKAHPEGIMGKSGQYSEAADLS